MVLEKEKYKVGKFILEAILLAKSTIGMVLVLDERSFSLVILVDMK